MSRDQSVIVTILATLLCVIIWKLGFALVSTTAKKVWRQRECFHHERDRGHRDEGGPAVTWIHEMISTSDIKYRCTRCGKEWVI